MALKQSLLLFFLYLMELAALALILTVFLCAQEVSGFFDGNFDMIHVVKLCAYPSQSVLGMLRGDPGELAPIRRQGSICFERQGAMLPIWLTRAFAFAFMQRERAPSFQRRLGHVG